LHSGLLAQLPNETSTPEKAATWALFAVGLGILSYWLLKTSLGTEALKDIPRKKSRLPFYVPFVVLLGWMSAGLGIVGLVELAGGSFQLSKASQMALQYGGFMVLDLGLIALIVWLSHTFFARGLRGFGLRCWHLWSDFWHAGAVLLAVLPVVMVLVQVVALVGQFFFGPDFKMQENEGLTDLAASSSLWVKVLIVVFAGVIVPCYEEMLFRGLIQSMMRTATGRPWASIAITSALFASLHPPMHIPALFALSMAIGYSYEKSGSLTRAIVLHSMFNITMLVAAILGQ
jgi:uncharacterized protein